MHTSNFFVREYFNEHCNYCEIISTSKAHTVADNGDDFRPAQPDEILETDEAVESEQEKEWRRERYKRESVRRARRELKFLTLNNVTVAFRMLTLTYAGEGCFDRNKIARDIQHMIEKIEKHEKRDIMYVCAFELHPGGHGYHAHLLIDCNYYKNETFHEMFWLHGWVKLNRQKYKNKVTDALNAARYITKYITKEAGNTGKGIKRYSASRNLMRDPYRYDLKFSSGDEIKKYVKKIEARGYRFVETYSYEIDGETFHVAFYKRQHHDIKSKNPCDRTAAAIATMFGSDECFT